MSLHRMIHRPLLLIPLLFLVPVGCGPTVAEGKLDQITATMNAAREQTTACAREVVTNPRFAPLGAHLNLQNASSPTLQQKADTTKPSVEDVGLLFEWHQSFARCRPIMTEAFAKVFPATVPIMEDAFLQADELILALVQRRISWGDYNRRAERLSAEARQGIRDAYGGTIQQLAVDHHVEVAQRAAVTAAIAQVVAEAAVEAASRRRR